MTRFPTSIRASLGYLLAQACLTVVSTAVILRLWKANLRIPFEYLGDTVFELALAKSIADGGWTWFIERLGAPFGLEIVAFPQNITFSSLVMKGIAIFTSDPGLILNGFWLLAVTLTSVTCHLALRSLSVSRASSWVMSTLYALLPYTLYRNTAHVNLTYIFVPVVSAFAVEVLAAARPATSAEQESPQVPRSLLLASCIAIGFDYVYTAFFACFFLVVAGTAGALFGRRCQPLWRVIPAIALVSLCAAVNVSPSLVSWHKHGMPPNMDYKTADQAEVYGLKIRHVITPVTDIPWAHAKSSDLQVTFPLENENQWAKLGVVGATGFLLALAFGLFGRRQGKGALTWSAGVLTIFGTLFATIGGFGVVFNLLVSPDIRAYNRIIVFLAFFAFLVIGLRLDALRGKFFGLAASWDRPTWASPLLAFALLCLLLIGLADQGQAAAPLVARYSSNKAHVDEEREIVNRIEQALPHVRQVYQLPETSFPPDPGLAQMQPYDHGRPYLWSKRLSWSWPSFSRRREAWSQAIGKPRQDRFVTNLVASGFDGLWLDRFGYKPSELAALEAKLITQLGKPLATSSHGRYLFFSLEAQRKQWLAEGTESSRLEARASLMEAIQVQFGPGFYDLEEAADGQTWHRWSQRESVMSIYNPSTRPRRVEFRAQVWGNPGGVLTIKSRGHETTLALKEGVNDFVVPLELASNSRSSIEFSLNGSKIQAPADPRLMYFAIVNSTVQLVK